ncbi:hypothetical protein U1Q18_000346 [Sarracenia purpurea var. burkii]
MMSENGSIKMDNPVRYRLGRKNPLVSVEMLKQAKGFDRKEGNDDRQKLEPSTDAQPMPQAKGARVRSVPTLCFSLCLPVWVDV